MRHMRWNSCLFAAMLLIGCVPERVTWSPDGKRAAVVGDDGLHVCDIAGKLSPLLVPEARIAAWLPDSKRMVVCVQRQSKTWSAQVYEIGETGATAGPIVYKRDFESGGIRSLRVAPTGDAVVLTVDVGMDKDQPEPMQLLIVPTDGTDNVCDLGRGAAYPDWTGDGKNLVFIRPSEWSASRKELLLGILVRQQVIDINGHLLDTAHLPKREDLAGMLFDTFLRVRMAKDGRIFFSAANVSLPVSAADFNAEGTIFSFDPEKQATLTRVVARGATQTIGNAAQYFELSPDARYLSIPFSDGQVSVLDIAKGESQWVQAVGEANTDNLNPATLPVWRTSTELTFLRPVKNSTTHEVVRYSIPEKTATVISGDWPASVGGWIRAAEGSSNAPAAAGEK